MGRRGDEAQVRVALMTLPSVFNAKSSCGHGHLRPGMFHPFIPSFYSTSKWLVTEQAS